MAPSWGWSRFPSGQVVDLGKKTVVDVVLHVQDTIRISGDRQTAVLVREVDGELEDGL